MYTCIALTVLCSTYLLAHHDWLITYNACTLLVKPHKKKKSNRKTKPKPIYFGQFRNSSQGMSGGGEKKEEKKKKRTYGQPIEMTLSNEPTTNMVSQIHKKNPNGRKRNNV